MTGHDDWCTKTASEPHSMLIYSQVRQSDLQVSRFHDPQAVKMRFVKIIASP
jgi:hypothetical protein